jgi:hypothetical protein
MSDNDPPNADADAEADRLSDQPADEHPTDVRAERPDCLRVSEVPIYGEETAEAIGGADEDPYEVTATVQVPDGDRPLSDLIQRLRTATVEHVEEQPEGDYPFRQTPGALAKQGERAAFRQALNRLVDLASGAGLEVEAISQETRLFAHRVRLTEDVTGPSASPADGEPPVLGAGEEAQDRTDVFRHGPPSDGEDDAGSEADEWPGKWRASDQQTDSAEAEGPPAFRPLHDSAGQDDNRGAEGPPSAATDGGSGTGEPSRKPLSEVPGEDVPPVAIQGDGPRVATVVPVNVLRSENPPLLVAICSAVAKAHGLDPAWLPRGVEKWADGLMPSAIVDRTTAVQDEATATAAFRHVAGLCHSVIQDTEPTEVYYVGAGEPPAGLPVRDESGGPTDDPSEGDDE